MHDESDGPQTLKALRRHIGPFAVSFLALGMFAANSAAARHTALVFPATAGQPCCGAITAQGNEFSAILDSMNVEKRWLAREHVDWKSGESDRPPNYTGPGKSSHCSAFAAAVGERVYVYMLRPPDHSEILLASAQAEWFHARAGDNAGWKPLLEPNPDIAAQQLANQGNLVVIVYESPDLHKPGHIVIVRPSEKSLDALRKEGPQIVQAGMQNYNSTIAARAFRYHTGAWPNGVHYYWHAIDWTKVKSPAAQQ